jgi:uncharacterized protein YndB with AHSA1/START domain
MNDAPQTPLVIERSYRAEIADLWALWTTKDGFESWWGPEGFRVEVHAIEAKAGGALVYDMIADAADAIAAMEAMGQPTSHHTHGHFDIFDPHNRLSLVHVIDFIAGMDPYESRIDVAFAASGAEAVMTITLHPHRDPMWTRMSIEGFSSQLTKLDRRYGWKP